MVSQFMPRLQRRHTLFMRLGAAGLLSLIMLLTACGGSPTTSTSTPTSGGTTSGAGSSCPATKMLNGAGSSFDNPLFSKMFVEYPNVKCGANVNYQSVGSGTGINDLLQQLVDFGATDAPLTDTQLSSSPNGLIIHIPVTLGAVAISYNVQGVSGHLNLTGPVIAAIFLGKITSWDDSQIKALNAGVTLPHETITPVHRSDGSGTTGIFTHYLSAVSTDWQAAVGAGTTVKWLTGAGSKGNAGVAAAVKSTAGAIGYNELAYVLANNISYAAVQNADGKLVLPSIDGAKADAAAVTTIPADLRFFIVNSTGAASYPITGFSWVIVYQTQTDSDKGHALANLLWWMLHDGQQYSAPLNYAPLPDVITTKGEAQIKSMKCGGSPCYSGS